MTTKDSITAVYVDDMASPIDVKLSVNHWLVSTVDSPGQDVRYSDVCNDTSGQLSATSVYRAEVFTLWLQSTK